MPKDYLTDISRGIWVDDKAQQVVIRSLDGNAVARLEIVLLQHSSPQSKLSSDKYKSKNSQIPQDLMDPDTTIWQVLVNKVQEAGVEQTAGQIFKMTDSA
ncbi:MAG: hypothetical protein FRX49_11365 [Trebouxia sp. A1-2]|nr:MAG: hypothetical protein FRX49_11365 [Trebouxia sp. A1-2]